MISHQSVKYVVDPESIGRRRKMFDNDKSSEYRHKKLQFKSLELRRCLDGIVDTDRMMGQPRPTRDCFTILGRKL